MKTSSSDTRSAALVGDIGGTRARFALRLPDGTFTEPVILPSADFPDLGAAAREGLSLQWKSLGERIAVARAGVAVAGPITSDRVELTNVAWRFSIEETRRALGLERLVVINDLAALAWAIPALERDLSVSKQAKARSGKAFIEGEDKKSFLEEKERADEAEMKAPAETGTRVSAVVAVGTGLGVATLAREGEGDGDEEIVLASEGGHRDLSATSEREWRVVERLAARFEGHVSVERAVSGWGLANLWQALAELDGGESSVAIEPPEVTRRALAGEPRAVEAVRLFSGWLGAFVGDLVLTVGAREGIWIGGGVLGALGAALDEAEMVRRFRAKGRFEDFVRAVPVRRIEDPIAALRGVARALDAR